MLFPQVNAETISEVGDAKQAICDAVQKLNITLLVLGDRGIGRIRRLLLLSFPLTLLFKLLNLLHITSPWESIVYFRYTYIITENINDTGLFKGAYPTTAFIMPSALYLL